MWRVARRLHGLWRALWMPRAVREVEELGLRQALDALPRAETTTNSAADDERLSAMQERLNAIERRQRELARLLGRRREETP